MNLIRQWLGIDQLATKQEVQELRDRLIEISPVPAPIKPIVPPKTEVKLAPTTFEQLQEEALKEVEVTDAEKE